MTQVGPTSGSGSAFCRNCGQPISEGARFCPSCGATYSAQPAQTVYCPTCGATNPGTASRCASCGNVWQQTQRSGPVGSVGAHVPNYLVQAILVTVFCCLPLGIVSIVFAAQVNSKLASGDYQGAVATSNSARTWAWVSFGVGLAGFAIWVLLALASITLGGF